MDYTTFKKKLLCFIQSMHVGPCVYQWLNVTQGELLVQKIPLLHSQGIGIDVKKYFRQNRPYQWWMDISRLALPFLQNAVENGTGTKLPSNWEDAKKYISFRMASKKWFFEYHSCFVSESYLDIGVVMGIFITNETRQQSVFYPITKELMQKWNVDIDILKTVATDNYLHGYVFSLKRLDQYFQGCMLTVKEQEPFEHLIKALGFSNYVLCSEHKAYGANALYISSLLDRLAQRMKCDFYLIPVSVHGLIIHKKHDLFPLSFFKEALRVLKENIADPAEPLSNTIYIYSRNSHTIELCTQ